MRYKIVLINFPFDDFSATKLRPAICLTNPISRYSHIILAPITSNLNNATEPTDVIIETEDVAFKETGLKVSSVIKLHRLVTASDIIIQKTIGSLPESFHPQVSEKIKLLFELD